MVDEGGDNIVIRTMKDDLTGGGTKPPSPAPLPNPSASSPTPSPGFPLPPRPASPAVPPTIPAAFRSTPNVTRRNRRRLFLWLGGGLGVATLIAAGAWAFVTFVSAPAGSDEAPAEVTASASEILPTGTGIAVHYSLETPADRSRLLELWQSSPKTLLQGNPKTLISDPQIQEFMYVGIPGESRPFLLVPKEQASEQLVSQVSPEQVSEKNGWYIFHSLNPSPYIQALTQGAGLPSEISARFAQKTAARPLYFYLSELALNQIRGSSAGDAFATGAVKQMVLTADLASGQNALAFDGFGEIDPLSDPSGESNFPVPPKADQALLAAIPADTRFVRLGGNLAGDITAWEDLTHVLDKTVLDQSAIAAFLKQLTGPYAYYQRLGADGVEDLGLLTMLPAGLTPPVALGDAALEQALPALVPLILPVKPVSLPAFADGIYQNVPLRFANLVGSTKALDYAIQNNVVMLATSKEGMFSLLDVAGKKTASLEASPPWQALFTAWGAAPVSPELFLGYLKFSSLLELLPTSQTELPFGLTQEAADSGVHLTGVLLL